MGSIVKETELLVQKMKHTTVLLVPSKSPTAESLVIIGGPPLETDVWATASIHLGDGGRTPNASVKYFSALKLAEDVRGH